MKLKIAVCLALALILQSSLTAIWRPLNHIDFALIIVVYFALGRNAEQAVIVGTGAGLSVDALSGGVLGTNGFTKTLIGFLVAMLATRVNVENPLARIPVIAGASALNSLIYVSLHRLLGQPSLAPFPETAAFNLIATTTVGTFTFYILDRFFSERAQVRRQFAFRRRAARRRLGRRNY